MVTRVRPATPEAQRPLNIVNKPPADRAGTEDLQPHIENMRDFARFLSLEPLWGRGKPVTFTGAADLEAPTPARKGIFSPNVNPGKKRLQSTMET